MKQYTSLIWIFFLFVACESPMNNRVEGRVSPQEQLKNMRFDSFTLDVEVQWLTGPVGNINKDNQLLVIVKNEKGDPVSIPEGYSLNFYATMPSMGHAMDDAGFFEYLGDGIYLNKTIRFNMPGDWKSELWVMDQEFNVKDKVVWQEFF